MISNVMLLLLFFVLTVADTQTAATTSKYFARQCVFPCLVLIGLRGYADSSDVDAVEKRLRRAHKRDVDGMDAF